MNEHDIVLRVGETQIGVINVRDIRARAQLDLEATLSSATPVNDLIAWLVRYASVDAETARTAIADMPLSAIMDLILDIQEALAQGLLLSKKLKKSSSLP